ncbi:tryptophan 7-halogenase [Pseudoduganella sp. LjRoot289]|uniref:tryptophan halogenase family protein n=1 Tax=Pseudoduganella sp. LjRoot289 TaxID=3342314 RepID=UPI003ECCFDD6
MINSIAIVGGGTSGWMAAAYLNKVLSVGGAPIAITVVESDDIGIIGVGEATVPTIKGILAMLEIQEWEFMVETDATFKNAIRFQDWLNTPGEGVPGNDFYHLFEAPPVISGFSAATHWTSLADRGAQPRRFDLAVGVQGVLCENARSPKSEGGRPYEAPVPYAYHLDAVKFGQFLRRLAVGRGVRHVVDTVTEVRKGPEGEIAGLLTQANGELQADFYIDCSGFRSLLLGGALEEPFCDWSEYLLCDRAVACQLPHASADVPLRSYTTSSAKEAGWIWEIDLFTRRGNGYVYSSRHSTPERAEEVLREHLGPAADGASMRHLDMQIGHRRNMWVKNCLGLGLAGGFLEPLESTGIYLVEVALSIFVDHIGTGPASPYLAQRFNGKMQSIYEELRDFIQMHYVTSNRDDTPFWRDYTSKVKMSDNLKYKLDLWTFKLPTITDLDGKLTLFGPSSYAYILAGMDRLPALGNHLSPYVDPMASAQALREVELLQEQALKGSREQREYLHKHHATGR